MSNPKFDWTGFTDSISSIEWFKNSVRESNKYDGYAGKKSAGEFKATVLTNLFGLPETVSATVTDGDANKIGTYIFKAYIDPKFNNTSPHSLIQNPCDLAEAGNAQGALDNTMLCTTFEVVGDPNSADFPSITAGSIVLVEMFGGDFSVDYQKGRFLKVIHSLAPTGPATAAAETCESIKEAFSSGGGIFSFSGKGPWMADYNGVAGSLVVENGRFPDKCLARADTAYSAGAFKILIDAKPSYDRLAQAYLAKFGKKLPINGGFRCYQGGKYCQVETKQRKGKFAATPGTSLHGWGLAFDFDAGGFESERYKWMFANGPKYGWVNPGWARDGVGIEEAWHFEFVGDPSGNKNPISNKRGPNPKDSETVASQTTGDTPAAATT